MSKFEISKNEGQHSRFVPLLGRWTGMCKTWFEKDVLADESVMEAEVTMLFDGRFLKYDYQSSLNGKLFQGQMIWAYDLGNEKCQCSWVDTFHMGTGILHSEGQATANGFVVTGSYGWIGIDEPWGWRTELEINGDNQFTVTAYNISPQGEEAKATETIYLRKS